MKYRGGNEAEEILRGIRRDQEGKWEERGKEDRRRRDLEWRGVDGRSDEGSALHCLSFL